ncbi:hypothetical protein NDU88_001259 [Pleurodeles waltl]|uniref:Uncharacterized protein n=1 Tax=Pleurodeles waltl TaxID=8319 RepID=A0AAV7WLM6_PLEWA|nr:hypothetical protein NDU88_001259 [Pleurodeles waltl]
MLCLHKRALPRGQKPPVVPSPAAPDPPLAVSIAPARPGHRSQRPPLRADSPCALQARPREPSAGHSGGGKPLRGLPARAAGTPAPAAAPCGSASLGGGTASAGSAGGWLLRAPACWARGAAEPHSRRAESWLRGSGGGRPRAAAGTPGSGLHFTRRLCVMLGTREARASPRPPQNFPPIPASGPPPASLECCNPC